MAGKAREGAAELVGANFEAGHFLLSLVTDDRMNDSIMIDLGPLLGLSFVRPYVRSLARSTVRFARSQHLPRADRIMRRLIVRGAPRAAYPGGES